MSQMVPVITLDGPSGSGKGTIAGLLARELGWHMLDSGALYRVVALGSEERGIAVDDVSGLCIYAEGMDVQFSTLFPGSIVLDRHDVSDRVRLEESGAKASRVAVIPELRQALLRRQYAFRQPPGLVADGRDMGTVVFPDALLKIFLTASAEVRAERRYKQLKNKGVDVTLRALLEDIRARDARDSGRAVAPLVPADAAVVIDTDTLSAEQVYALVRQLALSRLAAQI